MPVSEADLTSVADLRDESSCTRGALSALGRLLGAALVEPPRTLRSFAQQHLGLPADEIVAVTTALPGVLAPLVRVAVGGLIDSVPGSVLANEFGRGAPSYELVRVAIDNQVAAPDGLAGYLPAGSAHAFASVVVLAEPGDVPVVELHVAKHRRDEARDALRRLVADARGAHNFYRGNTLRVTADDWRFDLTPIPAATTSRDDIVHAETVWSELDANVGGLLAHADVLVAAGLGASRGLLVAGPPGVGKTALCRVIAAELPAGTTVLVVDPAVTASGLARVYDAATDLAPAAVVLDDIDLMAGDRRRGSGGPNLGEFLAVLDGFRPQGAVITVATTNDAASLDPALVRPGRFDAVVEVGPPDRAARAEILRRVTAPLATVDVAPIADRTDGATGADLREIVRRAVLETGRDITTAALLEIVRTGRWRPKPATGQYL